jgi:hypothetical protein
VPILGSSAYNTADDVLMRVRTICNDSEIAGGDVITSTAPFGFDLLNAGFERVQLELAKYGVEVDTAEVWLIGLPVMPTVDPEARMVIDDTGCNILYPNGVGNVFRNAPALPADLVVPLKLSERQTGTTNQAQPLRQPNSGLVPFSQDLYLRQWEWEADGIRTLGAMQSLDAKLKYEKHLPKLVSPTDPVPIRGVVNAAAYFSALIYAEGRGGVVAPNFKQNASEEIFLLQQLSVRRKQHKQVRRRPYSGRGGRSGPSL